MSQDCTIIKEKIPSDNIRWHSEEDDIPLPGYPSSPTIQTPSSFKTHSQSHPGPLQLEFNLTSFELPEHFTLGLRPFIYLFHFLKDCKLFEGRVHN